MSESLLIKDISSWLIAHAYGSAKAMPRRHLLYHLHVQGHSICDRRLRKIYGQGGPLEGKVGSSGKGLFWIVDAEDRRISQKGLRSHAMSELVREKAIKDAAPCGQRELFG
jgi:hypothetical protein